jgi:hypothetical protein
MSAARQHTQSDAMTRRRRWSASSTRTAARLVLVDALEVAWQRARYRGNHHSLIRADHGLVGLNTLQHWLWQRLQAPPPTEVHA